MRDREKVGEKSGGYEGRREEERLIGDEEIRGEERGGEESKGPGGEKRERRVI